MSIRTEAEYRAALARLDAERVILASRCFTDDEQRDFEALVRDIETYKAGGSPIASTVAPPASPPAPSAPTAASDPLVIPHASIPGDLSADRMRGQLAAQASMQRELARQGLAAASSPRIELPQGGAATAQASMDRELKRAGMVPHR